MALKQVKVMLVSNYILIMKNAIFFKTFDAELMFRTAAVHLSCFENNFFEMTIPFLNLKKNDEKIFFNFMLFSGAGMNNTQEKPFKTIFDVKKML
jgi:hypothetical protein